MRARRVTMFLLAACALMLAGCLQAAKEEAISYDRKNDVFRLLKVYYHIYGGSASELAYMTALYDNRREVIPADVLQILEESAYVRVDGKHFYEISLGEPKEKPAEAKEAPFDLSTIKNKPGHFFLTESGTLAYYHQIDIPGAVIDALIKAANQELNKSLAQSLADEITRRKDGGAVASWDRLRLELTGHAPEPATTEASDSEVKDNPWRCLDMESIALLLNAATTKRSIISRSGSTITVSVPLSESDRRQVQVTFDTIKREAAQSKAEHAPGVYKEPPADQAAREKKDESNRNDYLVASLPDLVKLSTSDNVISATADIMEAQALLDRIHGPFRFKAQPEEAQKGQYALTVEMAKAHGIPLDSTIKLQDVLTRFRGGDLPVDQEMKVQVGEGLFKAAEAK